MQEKYPKQRAPSAVFFILLIIFFVLANAIYPGSTGAVDAWLGPLWLAEAAAFIVVAIFAIRLRHNFHYLAWVFAGIASLLLCFYIISHQYGFSDVAPGYLKNSLGRVFFVLDNAFPYTNPFHQIGADYMLESSGPEFLETQVFMLIPFGVGYLLSRTPKNRDGHLSGEYVVRTRKQTA